MEKRPIAMKCSSKQFRKITRKLNGLKIVGIGCFDNCAYLVNNCDGDQNVITNIPSFAIKYHKREIYETWNENIFLEACGIGVGKPKDFTITKDQISDIFKLSSLEGKKRIKMLFPSVFEEEKKELVVEIGKWYKSLYGKGSLFEYLGDGKARGFFQSVEWDDKWSYPERCIRENCREATKQEVKAALAVEAKKRYKDGDVVDCIKAKSHSWSAKERFRTIKHNTTSWYHRIGDFWISDSEDLHVCVFCGGNWAEILPTISPQQAEEKLKELGINVKIV